MALHLMNFQNEEICQRIVLDQCEPREVFELARKRLEEGPVSKEENPVSHFGARLVPFDPSTNEELIVDHKKAGTWLFPGGHLDKDEDLLRTLNREISEELGVADFYTSTPATYLVTRKLLNSEKFRCREHFDLWHIMEIEKERIVVDMKEFNGVRWVTYEQALQTVTDDNNLRAIEAIKKLLPQFAL